MTRGKPVRPLILNVGDSEKNEQGGAAADEKMEGEMEEVEDEDYEEEVHPKVIKDPGQPTSREINEHNVTHLPFRSWCPLCVQGRAKDDPHRSIEQEVKETGTPIISMDYEYLGKRGRQAEEELGGAPTIVMRCHRSKVTFAHVCKSKGASDTWVVKKLAKDIDSLGYGAVILRADGEPAIVQLQEAIKDNRTARTKCENSPVGDSRANGVAEKANQEVAAQVRVMKLALQKRIGCTIPEDNPIMEWMVEAAALLITRFSKGVDGKTPVERLTGRQHQRPMAEFGENVMYRIQKKA